MTEIEGWNNLLMTCRLDLSACIPWTTGKENFPSVRSSAKPLFDVYYSGVMVSYRRIVLWSHLPRRFANSLNHHEFERTRRSDLRVERSSCVEMSTNRQRVFYRERTRQYLWYSTPSWAWYQFEGDLQFLNIIYNIWRSIFLMRASVHTVVDHSDIFLFRWTPKRVTPYDLLTLSAM